MLSSIAVQRPVTTLMFFCGIVMLGVFSFFTLTVDFLPSVDIPRITIKTSYPSTSPEEVERAVTQPIESVLGTVAGVKRIRSITRQGMSIVAVHFAWGTSMDFAVLEAREKLDQVLGALPREVGRPTILRVDPSSEPIMTIAVSSLNPRQSDAVRALADLKESARALLKRRIEQVAGVAHAEILGGVEREIHVDVRTKELQAFGINLGEVSEALASANISLPGGTIRHGLFRYSIRTLGEFRDCDDIRNVVLRRTPYGRSICVRDVATVLDTYRQRVGLTRFNGHEVIVLQIHKEAGSNTVAVSQSIHSVLDHLAIENPSLALEVIADQAEFIGQSVSDVKQAILIGVLLAFVVLFYFLHEPRYPIIIGITIPISILATLVAMYFLHINLNIMSLSGLALGIGMLGDNGVVLIENVTRLTESGKSLLDATLEGAEEIGTAVTASTLTNVAIFLPIVFVEGVAAKLFVDMGITMTISLLVSLLVAITLVPMLASRVWAGSHLEDSTRIGRLARPSGFEYSGSRMPSIMRTHLLQGGISAVRNMYFLSGIGSVISALYQRIDRIDGGLRAVVERYLSWALDHRARVLAATLGLLVLSLLLSFLIPAASAPDIDQCRFIVEIRMPRGTSLDGISKFSLELEDRLVTILGINGVFTRVGTTEDNTFWNVDETAPETAHLEVAVSGPGQTAAIVDSVRALLRELSAVTAGIEYAVRSRGTSFEQILRPEPNDITCRITGKDQVTVKRIAGLYADRIRSVPGLVDLRESLQEGTPEYHITIDREATSRYGLTVQAVLTHLVQHVRGYEATTLNEFDRRITIRVQPSYESRNDINALLASALTRDGRDIPIRSLVDWQETEGFAEIWRENQQRAYVLAANVSGRSVASVVAELEAAAKDLQLPTGYTIQLGGENEEIRESFEGLFIVILLSVLLVFMILAAEYESILYPLVILFTSPLAFIGAIVAMFLSGQTFNVISLVGLVIMIGAVDNDAVILVDVISELRREGVGIRDAILRGMGQRLRPIFMTTATTVLGIIPLVFEFGTGLELVRALAIPLVGGLIASTVFTVMTIPVVYSYVDGWDTRGGVGLP